MNKPALACLFAIAVAVGGSATTNEASTATRAAEGAKGATSETAGILLRTPTADAEDQPARRKLRCKDCGVIESVDRIERPDLLDGVCTVSVDVNIRGNDPAADGDPSQGLPNLSNMTRRVAAAQASAQSVPMPPRYRIVVRLRNGTRYVFDEATSRTLRSGDFVRVI